MVVCLTCMHKKASVSGLSVTIMVTILRLARSSDHATGSELEDAVILPLTSSFNSSFPDHSTLCDPEGPHILPRAQENKGVLSPDRTTSSPHVI